MGDRSLCVAASLCRRGGMSDPIAALPGGFSEPAKGSGSDPHRGLVAAEQLREHYCQIPAMAVAPTLGMAYTAWVLWAAVP